LAHAAEPTYAEAGVLDPTGAVAGDCPLVETTLRKTETKISPSIKGVTPATGRDRDENCLRTWNRQENLFRVTLGINPANVNHENGFQGYLFECTRLSSKLVPLPGTCPLGQSLMHQYFSASSAQIGLALLF